MHNNFDQCFTKPGTPVCPPLGPGMHPEHKPGIKPVINPYNKICFRDKKEAKDLLINKDLHTGEIAIAYYHDKTVRNGINAIIGVGNIKVNAPNILFDNYEDLNKWIENLSDASNELHDNIELIKSRLSVYDKLDSKVNEIDDVLSETIHEQNTIKDNVEELHTATNNLQELVISVQDSIDDINTHIGNIKDDETGIVNSINSLHDLIMTHESESELKHTEMSNEFKLLVADLSTRLSNTTGNINNGLDQTKYEFENLLVVEISKLDNKLGDMTVEFNDKIDNAKTTVKTDVETTIKVKTDELSDMLKVVKQDVSLLNLKLDNVHTDIKDSADATTLEFTKLLDDFKRTAQEELKRINDKLAEHEQVFNSTVSSLKQECEAYINDKVSKLHSEGEFWVNDFKIKLSTLDSATNAKFDTINSNIKTELNKIKDEFESQLRNVKSELITEYKKEEARQAEVNDLKYMRKGECRQVVPAINSGILLKNGELSLDIDIMDNIFHMGNVAYKLERVYNR